VVKRVLKKGVLEKEAAFWLGVKTINIKSTAKKMSQVKELKGLNPNVAGLQHNSNRQIGPSPYLPRYLKNLL